MLKMSENPPLMPPGLVAVGDAVGPWWVGHTKARFEKAFAWDLHDRGIAYFIPMVARTRMSQGRKRTVVVPLFTSYVFFAGDEMARYQALSTDRLCQVIPVRDQTQLVSELHSLHLAIKGGVALDPYPFVAVGRRCRVTAGPLQGTEGIIVSCDKVARVVLQISMFGQGASLEIETDLLEPLD
jgi:transcriptional antiterminator RfaH